MRERVRRSLPWLVVTLIVGVYTAALLTASVAPLTEDESDPLEMLWVFSFLGFGVVGALILNRLPSHRLGWVLVAIPLAVGLTILSGAWSRYALITRRGELPLGEPAAWVAAWIFQVGMMLIVQLVILFPHGHGRSRLWRVISTAVTFVGTALAVVYAVRPGPLDNARPLHNPYGVASWGDPLDAVIPYLGLALGVAFIAAIVDKVYVFRRSTGIERQQLKWFALSPVAFILMFAAALAIQQVLGTEANLLVLAFFPGFSAIAAAIGIAVLKHRLYDIDLVVNRTLVYALLTAVLVGLYLGAVFLFQQLASGLTTDSDLAVAASTLLVAAAFRPLRVRVQGFIDRRFYRRKYDAQHTLETFSSRLRDEVDLSQLSRDLSGVVRETMQPTHVSVWLREVRP